MNTLTLGIDIGSTTAKAVLLEGDTILFQTYERHFSQVRSKTLEILEEMKPLLLGRTMTVAISGSAGLGMAEAAGVPFVQEVYATGEVVRRLAPDTGTVIELGGEDAKVIFFKGGVDERMNGSCAGGTGAFIDQMAVLLDMSVEEMDRVSLTHSRIYPIASRCGVFAKTDIQPLLNQGASKADVAASIYQAVVNQTITGLAQGRKIEPKVMFLGGPLYYCKGLRQRFRETLKLDDETAVFPEYGRFAVALGAALYGRSSSRDYTYESLRDVLSTSGAGQSGARERLKPLFASAAEYEDFRARHAAATVEMRDLESYTGKAWLGIDCGSTTTKLTLISEDRKILYSHYSPNKGNPVELVRGQLEQLYRRCGDRVQICGSACNSNTRNCYKCVFN